MNMDFDHFYLLFQPMFAPGGDKPVGAKALLRWRDDEFDGSESDPLELGYWVLRNAMADGELFLGASPDFILCVGVLPQQVEDPNFAERIEALSIQARFPLNRLCLEIGTDCQSLNAMALMNFAGPLHEAGIKIGIDNFDSADACLTALEATQADYVIFSPELSHSAAGDEAGRETLRRLAALVDNHHAGVYFKAVESEHTAEELGALTVRGARGWFFSEAVYFDELLEWIGM